MTASQELQGQTRNMALLIDGDNALLHAYCQRHGEMSRFRQDKMSHFLHRLCEKSKSWIAGPAAAKGKHGDGPVAIQITRGGQPFRWREVLL